MRIEFWVDYLCPVTYLTHKNLIKAIDEADIKSYEILYRSFEMVNYTDKKYDIMDVWMLHHNQSREEIVNFLQYVYPEYEKLKLVNVNSAHQLAHLAKRYNLAKEINTKILEAYFEDNEDISNHEVLINIGTSFGIDRNIIKEVLNNDTFIEQKSLNRENAFLRGIDRIPHLRINVNNHYNGYLSTEKLITILRENKAIKNNFTYCEAGVCNTKKAI